MDAMNEPQSSQAHDVVPDYEATGEPLDEAAKRFAHGDDVQAMYEQMRPDQRTAIAGEYIRMLTLAGDDNTEQFRQRFAEHTQLTAPDQAPTQDLLTAEQVARLDHYVRQHHPELVADVLHHPVTQSALAMPGAQPVEVHADTTTNTDKIMPTENVATSGAAYATSWEMMELGGERANELAETPHEQNVTPEGETYAEQRTIENAGEEGRNPSLEPPEHTP